jgi:hypothetical protein
MTRKRPVTWTYGPKINRNLIKMSSKSILWQSGRFPIKLARVPKTVCYSSRKSPERTFSGKTKIRTRLARRPTLVVLCLKLWSIHGGGTVRVTKCVILDSVWASNCLLGNATKRPVKGLEHGPYGPKINRNLIKCHLQRFCDNPGGFQKIGPGAENQTVCYNSRKLPKTDVFAKKIWTRLARRFTLVVLCLKLW